MTNLNSSVSADAYKQAQEIIQDTKKYKKQTCIKKLVPLLEGADKYFRWVGVYSLGIITRTELSQLLGREFLEQLQEDAA